MIKVLDKTDLKYIHELESSFSNINIQDDLDNNTFSHYLLYLIDDKIVGYINYYLIYERMEIANFAVLKEYQDKHIGTSLIEELINKYQNSIDNITLEVKNDNTKAIHIYEKMGFKKVAIREKYYEGIDGILMEWVKK